MTFDEWKIQQKQSLRDEYAFYNMLIFKLLRNKQNFVYHLIEAECPHYIAIALVD